MKIKSLILPIALIITTATSCNKNTKVISEDDLNTENYIEASSDSLVTISPSFYGTYKGILPCASCPGIETKITLNEDGTYERIEKYLETDEGDDLSKGEIVWIKKYTIVSLGNHAYKVENNKLTMLNSECKKVDGELADQYILTKK